MVQNVYLIWHCPWEGYTQANAYGSIGQHPARWCSAQDCAFGREELKHCDQKSTVKALR